MHLGGVVMRYMTGRGVTPGGRRQLELQEVLSKSVRALDEVAQP